MTSTIGMGELTLAAKSTLSVPYWSITIIKFEGEEVGVAKGKRKET